jgi:hypothetical protein
VKFIKLNILQHEDGTPGFIEDSMREVHVNVDNITLFNKSDSDENIIFVRLSCGGTLAVVAKHSEFVKVLNKVVEVDR